MAIKKKEGNCMNLCNYDGYIEDTELYLRIRPSSRYLPISKEDEFLVCVDDLLKNETVIKSKKYVQHGSTNCYQHQLSVSYYTYKICKALRLNYYEAARGAMLHDLFLYDWHDLTGKERMTHPINHPKVALDNAKKHFFLTAIEEDIIYNHMWPLTLFRIPKYAETYVVTLVDKMCCIAEIIGNFKNNKATE